ncbi:ferritin-like domain-containing protein [Flavobacterium sp. Arc3]|uniref:YciE/YciF ferroxidase family protein n=1 Tax=Flavobacterium sp. Arc3 TaxID=3046686 RepID=UPI00352E3CDD
MATTTGKKVETTKVKANSAHGLRDLFEVGLKDIYYAEKILSKTLPKMAKNASTPELATTLNKHLTETNEHISRLKKIFEVTGIKPEAKKCAAMEGILKESDEMIKKTDLGNVRDASLIASEQKVKHYEIATYGTLHAFAKTMGENKAADLLAMTLDEEKKADAGLTKLAMASINNNAFKADALTNPRM